jgi:hypothetical protein
MLTDRRSLLALVAGSLALPATALGQSMSRIIFGSAGEPIRRLVAMTCSGASDLK